MPCRRSVGWPSSVELVPATLLASVNVLVRGWMSTKLVVVHARRVGDVQVDAEELDGVDLDVDAGW